MKYRYHQPDTNSLHTVILHFFWPYANFFFLLVHVFTLFSRWTLWAVCPTVWIFVWLWSFYVFTYSTVKSGDLTGQATMDRIRDDWWVKKTTDIYFQKLNIWDYLMYRSIICLLIQILWYLFTLYLSTAKCSVFVSQTPVEAILRKQNEFIEAYSETVFWFCKV